MIIIKEVLVVGIVLILIFFMFFFSWLLVELSFKLKDILNHTILKEKYRNKLIKNIKDGIEFNNYKIAIYKGEKQNENEFTNEDDYYALYKCCPKGFYLSKGIDKELVDEFKNSELEAERLYEIYSEKIRKENLRKRVEFLESEIKDIKKRI